MNCINLGRILIVLFFCFMVSIENMHGQNFATSRSEEGIEISERGKRVLFFQTRPKSVAGKYERSGYVHPLYGLDETVLTDDMPEDHLFHRGIFWAWHQIILNGKSIGDGWVSENISFRPVKATVKIEGESVSIHSEMRWHAQLNEARKPIVREKTKITIFRSAPEYRIIDFTIQLFALVDKLEIGGSDDPKGYGGFCLRLKLPEDITFVSGDNTITPEVNAVNAGPWMDINGSFGGNTSSKSGVTVFGYRQKETKSYPWILRDATSMQNVPFPGRTPVALTRKGIKLNYRIIVHSSKLTSADIEKLYQQYIK